ncbi:hypothetical protein PTI98_012721 [Pleurotus ostreatus]|nr:hypothetical protein PTI98_012721 [Pleurotus ostreatus]
MFGDENAYRELDDGTWSSQTWRSRTNLTEQLKVVAIQLFTGEIHRDPTYVIHQVYIKAIQLADMLMMCDETRISRLYISQELEVQSGGSTTKLDDVVSRDNGVTGPTLGG